eukprot:267846-Rhodomonas_salina.2
MTRTHHTTCAQTITCTYRAITCTHRTVNVYIPKRGGARDGPSKRLRHARVLEACYNCTPYAPSVPGNEGT